jgi:thiol-disulfide isomerase/thioredoxin
MIKKLLLPVIAIASGLAIWSVLAQKSSEIPTAPPLTGWMQNFTPTEPAGPALEGKLLAEDGNVVALSDFRGKLVLVNFWATWCGPCIHEMPTLVRLHQKLGGRDFQIVALSEDRGGWAVITPFVTKNNLATLPVYHDPGGKAARALGVKGLPTTILFDGSGRELGRLAGVAEWDSDEVVALIRFYMGD